MLSRDQLRPLTIATVTIAATLILLPIGVTLLNAWPPQPRAMQWRYGMFGILINNLLLPTLGTWLLLAWGLLVERRALIRSALVVALIGVVALLFGSGLFVMDALQLRASGNEALRNAMVNATALAIAQAIVFAAIGALLAMTAWRGLRAMGAPTRRGKDPSVLVVGTSAPVR